MILQRRLWLSFCVTFIFLFIVVLLEQNTSKQISLAEHDVTHTHETLAALVAVTSELKDAETGQRGYLLTSEEDYLEPYYSALSNIPVKFRELEELLIDSPEQLERLAQLRHYANEKLAELDDTVLLHGSGRVDTALGLVLTNRGLYLMDEIRELTIEIQKVESLLLNQRKLVISQTINYSIWIINGGSILIFFIALVVTYLTSKSIKNDYLQLQSTKQSLAITNGELQSFVYRTSHDFKSPVLGIKSMAMFIEEDLKEGNIDEALDNVTRIRKSADTLENLVLSTLQLAKTDLSQNQIQLVDVEALLASVCKKLVGLSQAHEVKLRFGSGVDNCHIHTDPNHLMTIIENLVSNGIKYSDNKHEESFVYMDIVKGINGAVTISVDDNGIGIPKQHQAEVFGMFKQFHPDRANGTGLGMYIVKKSIERLGGDITFDSSSKGTQLTITIPDLRDSYSP